MRARAHVLGNEATLGEYDADLRVVGSEPHVAGHGQAQSDPDAATVDGADHRLAKLERNVVKAPDCPAGLGRLALLAHLPLLGRLGVLVKTPLRVSARAERAALAGHHDDAAVWIAIALVQCVEELVGEIARPRVHALPVVAAKRWSITAFGQEQTIAIHAVRANGSGTARVRTVY